MSASVSQGRQQEGTAPGASLMPVCDSCRTSRQPWEASWAYSAARKLGLCWCSPHPVLTQPRPCCSSTATALCQLLSGAPAHPPGGGPTAQGPRVVLALLRAMPSPSSVELPGAQGTVPGWACLLYTSPSAFKHGLDLPKALREVQQNLQMLSAREQCHEGFCSVF